MTQICCAQDHVEEVTVIAEQIFKDTTVVSPTSKITAEDLESINLLTAEDAVAYEPSLVIRRRYVGDPNGVMGIRGAGMFQTARSLVFADGLPLHYLLQTRWSGSPRWSLVGPNEIETAEVIYGPYSAEYSGNAMGGVVDIKTRTPDRRRFNMQGTLMNQQYDVLGTNGSFGGNKVFMSYEDRLGDFTVFGSYNRLRNESQPMTNYFLDTADVAEMDAAGVTGYIHGQNSDGDDVIYIGDSGAEQSTSELYKLKLGYDLGSLQLRGTIAFEQRTREENDKNNYLTDVAGNTNWDFGGGNFQNRFQQRESLLLGFGVSGELGSDWVYDIYATDFAIQKDEETATGLNPQDPAFGNRNGRLTAYGDTGWNTLDIKLGTQHLFGNENMRLSAGYYLDSYTLEIKPSDIDAITGEYIGDRAKSRGKTGTQALFAQWGYAIGSKWDLALGLRYEDWETSEGFYNNNDAPDRSKKGFSPKFSLAYMPTDLLTVRYSLARALRFPIAEELYRNEEASTGILVADASLAPEEGIHHNLMFDSQLENGLLRVNLFYDFVDNTIYNQRGTINDGGVNVAVSTFLAIDKVETKGIELIVNRRQLFGSRLAMRFNTTWTDASIVKNTANPAIEGKNVPRIPEWRANLILSYQVTDNAEFSTSFRYASNSFGNLDNSDMASEVYGAIDQYFFVNMKANWRINGNAGLSLGVDNLFDDLAYVAHPWPSRTAYFEARYSF